MTSRGTIPGPTAQPPDLGLWLLHEFCDLLFDRERFVGQRVQFDAGGNVTLEEGLVDEAEALEGVQVEVQREALVREFEGHDADVEAQHLQYGGGQHTADLQLLVQGVQVLHFLWERGHVEHGAGLVRDDEEVAALRGPESVVRAHEVDRLLKGETEDVSEDWGLGGWGTAGGRG